MTGYYNKKDGHTYFMSRDGTWIAYPTLIDGQVDFSCPFYCDDMDGSSNHGMSEEDKAQILAFITSIERKENE